MGAVMVLERKNGLRWQIMNCIFLNAVSFLLSMCPIAESLGSSGIRQDVSYAKAVLAPAVVIRDSGRASVFFENSGGGCNSIEVKTSKDMHAEGVADIMALKKNTFIVSKEKVLDGNMYCCFVGRGGGIL